MSRITTAFGAESTASDVIEGIDLTGQRAVVTGGASGIGIETARALAHAGAEVTIAVRDLAAGDKTAADIGRDIKVAPLDLADPVSVRSFVQAWDGPLHLLVNNAGVMACPEAFTLQGWELQFATNHLGHFALATGLHTPMAAEGARIVSVSSRGHLFSDVHLDDLFFARRDYEPWSAYGQSKTANILFAVEATRRWTGDGITANSLHPGAIMTNLARHLSPEALAEARARSGGAAQFKSVEQGAATSVLLGTSPQLEGIGGRYFEDCNEALPNVEGTRTGVAAYALDPVTSEALWEASLNLIKGAS
ncbi:MAG: family NAD(P)-dependent oxidoreductase [Frankiales bacterium]|nr:family NAD(P)-dependent oxidoreductase [Frankiales bacterium]